MNTDPMKPEPMDEDQFEYVKKQIIQTYLFLISKTAFDPEVIEVMKLSALADVKRRYEACEPWWKDQAAFIKNYLSLKELDLKLPFFRNGLTYPP